jgi:hypothetical protein
LNAVLHDKPALRTDGSSVILEFSRHCDHVEKVISQADSMKWISSGCERRFREREDAMDEFLHQQNLILFKKQLDETKDAESETRL